MYERIFDDIGGRIVIQSDGWSGEVTNLNERFQLDIDFTITNTQSGFDGSLKTKPNAYGICKYSGGGYTAIIGISLEHFGVVSGYYSGEQIQQTLGRLNSISTNAPAWGVSISPMSNVVDWGDDYIYVSAYDYTSIVDGTEHEITTQTNIRYLTVDGNCQPLSQRFQYVTGNYNCILKTDLPIFATDADLIEYAQSNGTITNKILNIAEDDPEHDYINDQKYYKLKNLFARGSGSTWTPIQNINYRIKPVGGKICLYKVTPSAGSPYEWRLKGWRNNYNFYASNGVSYDDDDDFYNISNVVEIFLEHSLKFGDVSYRVNIFDTDIPRWENEQDADDYINGLKDISECLNYDYIVRTNQEILGPDIGQADPGNDNGANGMVYSYGSRMYVMSSSHLAGFFADVFNTANINDILDGTKLFGSSQISAITGIAYFPCDISEFCTVTSPGTTPRVGSWVCPTATSNGYITKNDKMIDCGGAQLNPIYGDFRDLEPYNLLWVTLPFCGTHQLQLTKYLGKFISFKYSIDAVTGVCTCHIYADSIEMDSFDGVCSSSRPITAIDQTQYLSNVIGAVNSGMNAGTGAISSGAQAIAGAMTGNVAGIAGGLAGFGASGAEGVFSAYNVMQAVDNPPMTTRGSASGCQGFFGPTRIHLHFFQKKSVKPLRALELCGAPSNTSGTVAQFSGFLKCSTVKIADGFTGTNDELKEIMQYLKNGIYV